MTPTSEQIDAVAQWLHEAFSHTISQADARLSRCRPPVQDAYRTMAAYCLTHLPAGFAGFDPLPDGDGHFVVEDRT